MSDQVIQRFIKEVKEASVEIAVGAMLRPPPGQLETGVMCGKYQGLQFALEILDAILRDNVEKEKRS